jgi:hypothetical protein
MERHGWIEGCKEEVSQMILKSMISFVKEVDEWYLISPIIFATYFHGQCPVPFKPGISDLLLFKDIINKELDAICADEELRTTNPHMVARNLLSRYYYPYYGLYDEKLIREAKN